MKIVKMPKFRIDADGVLVVEFGHFDFAGDPSDARAAGEQIQEWAVAEANRRLANEA